MSARQNQNSFLARAEDLLSGASVTIHWQAMGEQTIRPLDGSYIPSESEYPRARYLSQQFVEDLCASEGMTDALLREIERVIFEAHGMSERDGAIDFDELLEMRATRHRQARKREEAALANLSDQVGREREKEKLVPGLRAQIIEKTQIIARYADDRKNLVSKGSEERVAQLEELTQAAEKVRGYLRFFSGQEQALLSIKDEVTDVRLNQAPAALRRAQEQHVATGLKGGDWDPFLLRYTGDVDTVISERLAQAQTRAKAWRGVPPISSMSPLESLIAPGTILDQTPLANLEAEIARVETLVGVDRDTANKFSVVSKRIAEESIALERLKERLTDYEQAKDRVIELQKDREITYLRVFESVLAKQTVLNNLYSPLMARLGDETGTLSKLSFTVMRVADIKRWAEDGEQLLDLRKQGPFKGHGGLQRQAEKHLKAAWETGDAASVSSAMKAFREENQEALLAHSRVPKDEHLDYRTWLKTFAQWLYSTAHITVHYCVDYDGVDIRKLSPGTRGIVLLLLYLALDDEDDRPLIIDQPEENLDPKSIFDELVSLFLQAKKKRQVIIVTHNANLVVNTDADQIIVARAAPHLAGNLPPITYTSGGLESAHIRKDVCDILEGGEAAFRERARRLRVQLER